MNDEGILPPTPFPPAFDRAPCCCVFARGVIAKIFYIAMSFRTPTCDPFGLILVVFMKCSYRIDIQKQLS